MGAPRIDKLDKNYLINGNFDFWQRGTGQAYSGTGGPVAGYSWADRFRFSVQSTNNRANRAVNRSTDVPTFLESGFRSTYSMQYTQTSALTLVGTDYLIWCEQQVEGVFYRDLHGKDMTLSFWFKSTVAGQYPASFNNGNLTRSYVTMFTYDVANVWQKIYITVPTDSGGTWVFDNASALRVGLCSDSNGTWDAPSLNTWHTGQYFTSSTGVQVQSQANITITVSQMQLSEGSIQREVFSMAGRDYANELRLCQRYYEKSYDIETPPQSITTVGVVNYWAATTFNNAQGNPTVSFKTAKRASPVMQIYETQAGNAGQFRNLSNATSYTGSFVRIGHNYATPFFGPGASLLAGHEAVFHWTADAEL